MKPAILHGAGNTFAVMTADELAGRSPSKTARELCAMQGLDGLLEVQPPAGAPVEAGDSADVRMVIWNADGSRAEACGNGLRCVALFCRERGLVEADRMRVETDCGTRTVELLRQGGEVVRARAGLGRARLVDGRAELRLGPDGPDGSVVAVLVEVGNPHCVVFVDEAGLERLGAIGPALAAHERFPAGTNVELAACGPAASRLVRARVWERGVGETAACGTGAAAIAVAVAETGRGVLPLVVALPGGHLEVDRDARGEVWLTGPVARAEVRSSALNIPQNTAEQPS